MSWQEPPVAGGGQQRHASLGWDEPGGQCGVDGGAGKVD
jgi:hypothetical protein